MVDENSDLPATWITTTVGKVYNIVGGGTPQTGVDEYWDGEIPWISSADIYGPRDIRPRRKITSRAIEESAANLVPANSIIVVTRVGLGKVALTEAPLAFSQDSQALTGQSELHADYVLHYLSKATQRFKQESRGTTIAGVTKRQLAELVLPLPPVAEQKRIVDEIETQFTRLDTAVADLRRLQHNLDRYRASVLKAAFEGRLVPQDTADEPAEQLLQRILAERRRRWEEREWQKHVERAQKKVAQARRKAAGRPSRLGDLSPEEWQAVPEEEYRAYLPKGEKWNRNYPEPPSPDLTGLPKLPVNWTWARVDQLGDVQLGRQRSPQHHSGPNMRPYLRAANATWNGVDLTDVKEMNFEPSVFEGFRLLDGDILLAEASGSASEVGKPFIWREEIEGCAFQNTLIRVRLDSLGPEYLKWHFYKDALTGRFGQIAKGVGIYHLGATRLAEMPIALPPIKEQQRIVDELDRRLSVIDELNREVERAQARANRLRQAILEKAFTGRLVPQEPDDEPAEKLLERIRKERHSIAEQLSLL